MSIGAGLARARHDAGLTLDQVSETTRVRKALLEALEHDDFDALGGDVYARGHLRSYCAAVGVDPEPFVEEFDRARKPARVAQPSMTQAFESERRAATDTPRRGPNWSAAMAVALAVVVAIGLFSLLTRGGADSPTPAAAGSTPSSASSPSTTTSTGPTSSSPSASTKPTVVAQRPVTGVRVVLKVNDASWVSASNGQNGRTFYEGILEEGERKVFTDSKKVRLVIGNAGGVTLSVNGRDLGAPGGDGEVVRVEFGPGDPTGSTG